MHKPKKRVYFLRKLIEEKLIYEGGGGGIPILKIFNGKKKKNGKRECLFHRFKISRNFMSLGMNRKKMFVVNLILFFNYL